MIELEACLRRLCWFLPVGLRLNDSDIVVGNKDAKCVNF